MKKIKPDWDVVDFDLGDISSLLQAQDINIIREDILNAIKFVFNQVQKVTQKIKKVFYIIPLIMLMVDAYRYMVKYQVRHVDNSISVCSMEKQGLLIIFFILGTFTFCA